MDIITRALQNVKLETEITIIDTITPQLVASFDNASVIALDVEGVVLSREGVVSIVQIAVSKRGRCNFLIFYLHSTIISNLCMFVCVCVVY